MIKEKCEGGCTGNVMSYDSEGVPLCAECNAMLKIDYLLSIIRVQREGLREYGNHRPRCTRRTKLADRCTCDFEEVLVAADTIAHLLGDK